MNNTFSSMCLPAKIYSIVMVAVIIFDLYIGSITYALSNTISLFIGTILLLTLCAAGMEFAAISLMILPVMFFVFLLAIVLYDQSLLSVRNNRPNNCTKKPNTNTQTNTCDEPVITCPSKCPNNRCCKKPVCECS
jgi:hypothetical protein